MGFLEVVPHIPLHCSGACARQRKTSPQKQPDAVVTIDSPGFNFRLARTRSRTIRNTRAIKRIHYVAPSVLGL